jgi:glycosyltransferase involved in cell wall biosynthesis
MTDLSKVHVAICTPIGRRAPTATARSFRYLQKNGLGATHTIDVEGLPIDVARNTLTQEALKDASITHIMWIDDDMVFPPDSLFRLLAHDKDIVGGLCFDRRHPYKPVIAREYDKSFGFDPGTLGWLFDYPPDELIEVDATGGAFLLIKREVFEDIRDGEVWPEGKYSNWWTPLPELGSSEDLSFMVRARKAGYKIHVDTGLKIGHVAETIVDEDFAKRNRIFEYAQWSDRTGDSPLIDAKGSFDDSVPVATIVIPTYNTPIELLRAAILSALYQTVPVEVIVVDDGSEPPVKERLWSDNYQIEKRAHLKFIAQDANEGISAALNTGIKASTTEWICWLSADDYFEPQKVEFQLSALLNARRLCSYTGYNLKLDNRNSIVHVGLAAWSDRQQQSRILANYCAINGSTTMIHRSIFDDVGFYDTAYRYSQDWEMWNRIGLRYDWFAMPDKLTTRREFGNLTSVLSKLESRDPRALRKMAEDAQIRKTYGGQP